MQPPQQARQSFPAASSETPKNPKLKRSCTDGIRAIRLMPF
jgi:hypothetical protein